MTEILLPNGERHIPVPAPGSWQEEMHLAFPAKSDAQFQIDAIERAVAFSEQVRVARRVIDTKYTDNLYNVLDRMYANEPAEADRVFQRIREHYPTQAFAAAVKTLVHLDTGKHLEELDHPALENKDAFVKQVKSTHRHEGNGKGSSTKDLKAILTDAEQKMQQNWTEQPKPSSEERSL